MRDLNHSISPRGQGNVVSAEFNLLYRWHATLSEENTQWYQRELDAVSRPGIGIASVADFRTAASTFTSKLKGLSPTQWEFGG